MNSDDHTVNDSRSYSMRRRGRRAQQLRDKILEAAFREFSTKYFVDVTVSAVAEAARCSEQTVYRKFGNKEGLFRALGEREGEDVTGSRDAIAAGDVRGAVERVVSDYESVGDVMLLIQAQAGRVDVIREMFVRGRDHHHAWVRRVFDEELSAQSEGARKRLHGQLVVALDVQTWKRLRRDLEFTHEETLLTMEELVEGLLSRARTAGEAR